MFLAIRLAKEGYFNGNPESVLQARADIVLQVLKFENTEKEYLECYRKLNENS